MVAKHYVAIKSNTAKNNPLVHSQVAEYGCFPPESWEVSGHNFNKKAESAKAVS